MPAQRFFLMSDVVDRLMGKEYVDQCFVARSARMENDAFNETIKHFDTIGQKAERPKDIDIESYKADARMIGGEEARAAVMAAFAKDTRIKRSVHMKTTETPHPRRKH